MKPQKSENTVAALIKVYACLNAAAGVIATFVLANELRWNVPFTIVFLIIALMASLLIYAIGEVIQLLHEIRNNTSKSSEMVDPDELPEL